MRPLPRPALPGVPVMRTTVILLLSFLLGAAAGALTYCASRSVPQALLASGTAISGSARLLGQITGATPQQVASRQDSIQDEEQNGDTSQARAHNAGLAANKLTKPLCDEPEDTRSKKKARRSKAGKRQAQAARSAEPTT